ncbi:hypothetical protein QE400_002521 [Xanthomonas sacchari]|uniref:hypothetical protein n=1 Tax=Xanthomonas sacchari TaxID=56458 RepID=UPI00278B3C67|nr:hypothetical protein [Xanthomonas sacchari]MDQ1093108.1 hypothetical protein [Xanthomonas sacchari]
MALRSPGTENAINDLARLLTVIYDLIALRGPLLETSSSERNALGSWRPSSPISRPACCPNRRPIT